MMNKSVSVSALIAVIALSAARTGWMVYRQRPVYPVAGALHRTTVDPTVDRGGHSRGIVQVNLMRQIIADRARAVPAEPGDGDGHCVSSQPHPRLGRLAPPFELKDSRGRTWKAREPIASEPTILVFYLGQTCMACVTHLVELDGAIARFRDRGARVLAISADPPEVSCKRLDRFGDFEVPLLSDPDHTTARAYGAWKPLPGGDREDGEPLHGTFVIDRDGRVRWAHVGERPFTDKETLVAEVDRLAAQSPTDGREVSQQP